ncbi:MAG TPA: outer membrane beta-barrel protein [Flavobacteriales bacterium]|nr:outer membrane beta-barrel protein [Flavobacteriales bacterium]HMR27992.1 outer membrane beta-barrel protein [Flavobacteriales bacterium]
MRRIHSLLLPAFALLNATNSAHAQIQVNPQVGLLAQTLQGDPDNGDYRGNMGWQAGVDIRLGRRVYFQPGVHIGRQATVVQVQVPLLLDTFLVENDLVRTVLKARALVGFNLVHKDGFKLRLNAGPSYDLLLSVDNSNDDIAWNRDDLTAGSFNLDAGVGLDIWFVTVEGGVSVGLNKVLDDDGLNNAYDDPRNLTWYATAGIVLGRSTR